MISLVSLMTDESLQLMIESASACFSEGVFDHVAHRLHVGLIFEAGPVVVRNHQHPFAFHAAIRQYVPLVVDRPFGLGSRIMNTADGALRNRMPLP